MPRRVRAVIHPDRDVLDIMTARPVLSLTFAEARDLLLELTELLTLWDAESGGPRTAPARHQQPTTLTALTDPENVDLRPVPEPTRSRYPAEADDPDDYEREPEEFDAELPRGVEGIAIGRPERRSPGAEGRR